MTIPEITDYIFLQHDDPQGDVAIVFGSMYAHLPASIAAQLYNSGKVKIVVFSGSINKHTGINEANDMATFAEKAGMPGETILIEDKATNTLENVLFSKQILEKKIGLDTIHAIVGVMVDCHARRALMTMRKHFPSHISLSCKTYSFPDFDRTNWFNSERGRALVYGEVERIEKYLAKGDIAEI